MEKELEVVAKFTEGNCTYTIKQPKKDLTLEELEKFHTILGKAIFGAQKPL